MRKQIKSYNNYFIYNNGDKANNLMVVSTLNINKASTTILKEASSE